MTRSTVERSVSSAEAEKAGSRHRDIGSRGEGGVRGGTQHTGRTEGSAIAGGTVMTHLATGFVQPAFAARGAHRAEVAVAVEARDPGHRASLAFRLHARVAEVTGTEWRASVVECRTRGGIYDSGVHGMDRLGYGSNAGYPSGS